jgi:hypothetical protein
VVTDVAGLGHCAVSVEGQGHQVALTRPGGTFSASMINLSDSSELVSAHKRLKSSTSSKLSLNRCRVLIKATTSFRCRRFELECGLMERRAQGTLSEEPEGKWGKTHSSAFSSSSKRTFSAVARPVV